jgi:dTDP-4-amino-4,6-dideoxygalactose transaminase
MSVDERPRAPHALSARDDMPGPEDVLPVFCPYLGPEVRAAAESALSFGWLGMGATTARFEDALSDYLGLEDRRLVATSTGTAALHCALVLAGVGPGDEVVCPSFTYVAGHQAVSMTGADVVFCDIEEHTLGIDPESLRAAIGPRTKAVLLLHFGGPAPDLAGIYEVAGEHGLRVVEDAAHAFGTVYQGRPVGSFGDLTCFSYGPVKIITSLDGGAVVLPDEADVQKLHELRLLGVTKDTRRRHEDERTWEYDVVRQGYRYHLGSVPAAIGLSQLELIDTFIANRQQYCRSYNERLGEVGGVRIPETDFTDVSPFLYWIRVRDSATRTALQAHMRAQGVGTGIHFLGAHEFDFYRGCRRVDLPVTEDVAGGIVSLPLYSFMDAPTRDRVVASVASFDF